MFLGLAIYDYHLLTAPFFYFGSLHDDFSFDVIEF